MNTNVEQNGKVSIVQKLDQTSVTQLANLPEVADRFKQLYKIMNAGNPEQALVKYEAEKFHFMKLLQDKADLQKCTKLSLYGCFLDMAVNGLSFDPAMKHAYVVAFNTNVGTKDNPKWEKRASLMISGYGELHMRVRQGQIRYADNPVLVYEGDHFQHGTKDGKVFLDHVATLPRKSDKIIGCYIRLERQDQSVDYKVLGYEEVMKFREFSKDKNSLAWTSGLPGMIQAKTIKHAFRSYPKVRMGEFSRLHSQEVETEHEELPPIIDYGIGDVSPNNATASLPDAAGHFAPTMVVEPVKNGEVIGDNDFATPAQQPKQGVTVADDNF